MQISYSQSFTQPRQAANFFRTFGFLTVRKIVEQSRARNLIQAFDRVALTRHGKPFADVIAGKNIVDGLLVTGARQGIDCALSLIDGGAM